MALPNVTIVVNRSGLGLVDYTDDGIMGLIVSGSAVANKLELSKAYAIYGLTDAEALGIEEAGVNATAHKQIKEFYDEAGNGVKIWILVSDKTLMSLNATGTTNNLKTLIEAAKGEISVVGICRGKTQSEVVVDGLNEDVWSTMAAVQILAEEYRGLIMPFSAVIDGIGFSGDASSTLDLTTKTQHRCSVILASTGTDKVASASVGQFLGREASIPVQRKPSRIKDGSLTNEKAYLTDGASIDGRVGALNTLHDRGYIVFRTLVGKSGFFYSGDPSATAATDDLNTIARNRVMDKVLKIAYNTYAEELDDDVPVTESGTLQPAVCGYLQEKIDKQVKGNMVDEISKFSSYVNPNQNILSGAPVEIQLSIVPKGYLNPIKVTIGFSNPYSS